MHLSQIAECLGMVLTKPRKAFEKIQESSSFVPGTILIIFIAIFSVIYSNLMINENFWMALDDFPIEHKELIEKVFYSNFIKFLGLIVPLIVHFFQTAFYLLWFQLFGYQARGVFLWNSLALCQFPSFLAQILVLFLLLLFPSLNLTILNNLISFAAGLWTFYLLLTAFSVIFNLRKLKALGILLLPWVILIVVFIILLIWIFVGFAEMDFMKDFLNQL
jgi:hypothetical protein